MQEKLILVGVETGNGYTETSLAELKELVRTAGAESAATVIQNLEFPNPATYVGKGKVEEIRELIDETGANGIVCDDELSPAQMKNLEDMLDVKVLDRTIVILDIFAARARTSEGKIQVELAQARYALTRLSGFGRSMSRLGGGIGTRGPGESKLETDRRRIRQRITGLKEELRDVVKRREVTRAQRERTETPVVAIVGYTNAGKSTLLNKLTGADVLSEDKLFATLDPTTRAYSLPSGEKVLFTDTVGFIHKLPHHLIDAFKSTLEEAKYADIIAHVTDYADPNFENHMKVVYETLTNLEVGGKPVITLFNKCDIADPDLRPVDPKAEKTIRVSALTGDGLSDFTDAIETILRESKVYIERVFPYSAAGTVQTIRKYGQLIAEDYTEEGISVKAWIPKRFLKDIS